MKTKAKRSKKRTPQFVLVTADNWQALFVDGKCVEQDHMIDLVEYLYQHGVDISEREAYEDPTVKQKGTFKKTLSNVEFD